MVGQQLDEFLTIPYENLTQEREQRIPRSERVANYLVMRRNEVTIRVVFLVRIRRLAGILVDAV